MPRCLLCPILENSVLTELPEPQSSPDYLPNLRICEILERFGLVKVE